ncbi:MAG: nucleoside recognition domain-containing protein [Dermatophilaceae bacterium]
MGLPGRAFLPLIVGFGCNVPAIAATRVLGGARQRILTALLVPFTSCSARLTVYVMLATTFFQEWAGTVVFAMYLLSILLIVGVGFALRRTLWRTMGTEPLLLDLPAYQRPTIRVMTSVTWMRLKGFLRTASGIVVATVCVVWLLQAVPVQGSAPLGETAIEDSAYAALAGTLAPAFAPAGFDQWQATGALVTGFVAKEAVISSWAQTYAVSDAEQGADTPLGRASDETSRRRPRATPCQRSSPSWPSSWPTPPVLRHWQRSAARSGCGGLRSACSCSLPWPGRSRWSSSSSVSCSGDLRRPHSRPGAVVQSARRPGSRRHRGSIGPRDASRCLGRCARFGPRASGAARR